jgi:uncharacterized DUF497 family protein
LTFEYDINKSNINREKHGIDFVEVQRIFNEDNTFIQRAKTIDFEDRYTIIGIINKKCYAVIFTYRGANIRIISARRCRKNEKQRINYD